MNRKKRFASCVHIRRCHICGGITESDGQVVAKCDHCGKAMAPFYFFNEGLEVPASALVLRSLLYGVVMSLTVLPIRIAKDWIGCRFFAGRSAKSGTRVAVALVPTLIFTLVIAGILHETFHVDDALFGGLLVYAAISTILPSFVLPRLVVAPQVGMLVGSET